jgi:hypothetical protein
MKKKPPAKTWHWAEIDKSPRLKRVVRLLSSGVSWDGKENAKNLLSRILGEKNTPYSAREISWYANVNCGNSCLAELRKNGVEIKSKTVKGKEGSYKVHWIEKQ